MDRRLNSEPFLPPPRPLACCSEGAHLARASCRWARLPCRGEAGEPPLAGLNASGRARLCPVTPADYFTCCGWPWVVPELRDLVIRVLRPAGREGLPVARLAIEMRRAARHHPSRNQKGCVRDCVDLQLPGAQHMSGVLRELEARGDVVTERHEHSPHHMAGHQPTALQSVVVRLAAPSA